LQQADLAQRRYVVQSWQDYARGRISSDFEIARQEAAPLRAQLLPAIEQAASQRRTLTLVPDEVSPGYSEEKSPAIVAPIQLRGEVIGTLALARKPDGYTWSEDEQAMVEAIAERLALAADNMRLLEETQRRAAREQLIGEITGHMRQTLDVETVLKTAVDEIYRVLELKEMTAWLAPNLAQATEAAPSHSSGNGHDAHPNGRKSARLDRADDPSKGE
jgi:GAF domain-containing protein